MDEVIPHTVDSELNTIIFAAFETSPLVKQAFSMHQAYYQTLYDEQQWLLKQNAQLWQNQAINFEDFYRIVLNRIHNDIAYAEHFNRALTPESGVVWSLKNNYMVKVLTGAKALLQDKISFRQILTGKLPDGAEYTSSVPVFLNPFGYYGNSKLTYLNAAIVEVQLALLGAKSKLKDLPRLQVEQPFIDNSSMLHVAPIPKSLVNTKLGPGFIKNYSFYYEDFKTPHGVGYVHSGYAYGGHRFEPRYPEGRAGIGPEDCSSWIAKLTQLGHEFNTADLLYNYRLAFEDELDFTTKAWAKSDLGKAMQDSYIPVKVTHPKYDIKPGMLYADRDFNVIKHHKNRGVSGHVGLVLGVRENGKVVILCYAREMPVFEGFGIKEYLPYSTPLQDVMFFEVKGNQAVEFIQVHKKTQEYLEVETSYSGEIASISQ